MKCSTCGAEVGKCVNCGTPLTAPPTENIGRATDGDDGVPIPVVSKLGEAMRWSPCELCAWQGIQNCHSKAELAALKEQLSEAHDSARRKDERIARLVEGAQKLKEQLAEAVGLLKGWLNFNSYLGTRGAKYKHVAATHRAVNREKQ